MRLRLRPALGVAPGEGGWVARVDAAARLPARVAGGEAGALVDPARPEDPRAGELTRRGGVRLGDGVQARPEVRREAPIAQQARPDLLPPRGVGSPAHDQAVVGAVVGGGHAGQDGDARAAVPGAAGGVPASRAAAQGLQHVRPLRVEGAGVAVRGTRRQRQPTDRGGLPHEDARGLPGCAGVGAAAQRERKAALRDGGEQHLVPVRGERHPAPLLHRAERPPGAPRGVGAGVRHAGDRQRTAVVAGADDDAPAGNGEGVGAVALIAAVEALPGKQGDAPAFRANGHADVGNAVGAALMGAQAGGDRLHAP